jgi:hypothetical protein
MLRRHAVPAVALAVVSLTAIVALVLTPDAGHASQPVWTKRAAIVQVGDRLLFDSGDYFTAEGTTVSRRVFRLLRNGRPVLGEVPPVLSRPETRIAGEGVREYRLRLEDYGQSFVLETYGGVISDYSHIGQGRLVEWGGANVQTGERPNRSEVFVPKATPGLSKAISARLVELARLRMLEEANAQLRRWRREGQTEKQIGATRIARARAILLGRGP